MNIKEIWNELGRAYLYRMDRAICDAVSLFVDKYFTYDDWSKTTAECVDWESERLSYNRQFWDYFFSLSDIYTALWYDIPSEILFEWYDTTIDEYLGKTGKTVPNLENFYKLKIKDDVKKEERVWREDS